MLVTHIPQQLFAAESTSAVRALERLAVVVPCCCGTRAPCWGGWPDPVVHRCAGVASARGQDCCRRHTTVSRHTHAAARYRLRASHSGVGRSAFEQVGVDAQRLACQQVSSTDCSWSASRQFRLDWRFHLARCCRCCQDMGSIRCLSCFVAVLLLTTA